jgi:hypothetical protein
LVLSVTQFVKVDLSTNIMPRITVGIRVKPEEQSEIIKSFSHRDSAPTQTQTDGKSSSSGGGGGGGGGIIEISANGAKHEFAFDHIFGADVSQEEVFSTCARGVLDSVMDGFNGTLFAYGQTGAGKTHTGE